MSDAPDRFDEPPSESFFARSLRYWRKHRGLSQMDLALEAEVSTRHLSFLETDRSRPGREVLERLLRVLNLEALDRRALLTAAGFPPEQDDKDSGPAAGAEPGPDPAMRAMFQRMLDQQEPYPGFVLNAFGDIAMVNGGARRLFSLLDSGNEIAEGELNLFELYFAPDGFGRWMQDAEVTGRIIFAQVRQDLLALNSDRARGLLDRLLAMAPYLNEPLPQDVDAGEAVFESVLRKGDLVLRLQSAMAILGSPHANAAPGWRLETIFPIDEATSRFFR